MGARAVPLGLCGHGQSQHCCRAESGWVRSARAIRGIGCIPSGSPPWPRGPQMPQYPSVPSAGYPSVPGAGYPRAHGQPERSGASTVCPKHGWVCKAPAAQAVAVIFCSTASGPEASNIAIVSSSDFKNLRFTSQNFPKLRSLVVPLQREAAGGDQQLLAHSYRWEGRCPQKRATKLARGTACSAGTSRQQSSRGAKHQNGPMHAYGPEGCICVKLAS